jgi:hypothetical protein
MLWLSEVLLQEHDLDSFEALVAVVRERARGGEMFFRMDVRPPYPDTPEDWEDRLEAAFSSAQQVS